MNDIELIDEIVRRADEHQKQKEKEFAIAELEALKAEIGIYYNDCLLSISDNDEDCKICNKNVFESIFRKIDKHISELKGENKDCIDCNNNCDNGCCKKGCIGYCEGKYWAPKVEIITYEED